MIELAPASKPIQYEEAELYIWTCTHNNKHDWRMPTLDDVVHFDDKFGNLDPWNQDIIDLDFLLFINAKYQTVPVRNKDD